MTEKLIVPIAELEGRLRASIADGARLGTLTARRITTKNGSEHSALTLVTVILNPATANMELWETPLDPETRSYPSLTPSIPQAHWFERALWDLFGLYPESHPRMKGLLLHEAWPQDFHPLNEVSHSFGNSGTAHRGYEFLTVQGEGVYEIPVGPIHAGIIEPGHFRFSCLGEVIQNLEIRLGYQHRGIERQLTEVPWRRARFLAEASSGDTTVGNALAHAMAIEQILNIASPNLAVWLRALALEIERVASHIGDLGGVCADIGYAGGAAIFGRLRGQALGMGERLTGARFQISYIVPGGVRRPLTDDQRQALLEDVCALSREFPQAGDLLLDNAGAMERMEGTGRVRPSLARDFGLVGPAGRASGSGYDVRQAFPRPPYDGLRWEVANETEGDVLARVRIRVKEAHESLSLIQELLLSLPNMREHCSPLPDSLPPNRFGVGIVEAWRGELIHLIFTDEFGAISRYHIKDPSFNNWTGLSIAARRQLVADFPLCNKSFGLSYSGNDL